jgi:hypothetical protein
MQRTGLTTRFLFVSGAVIAGVFLLAALFSRYLADSRVGVTELRRLSWIFACLVAGMVVAASLVQVAMVLPRLRRILRGMEEVRSGTYPRLLVEGGDEVAETVRGFNETVEALRSRDDKLRA